MQSISKTRIGIVLFVTLFSILATVPTARYYLHVSHKLEPKSPRPAVTAAAPDKSNVEAYAEWSKKNPEFVKWAKENAAFVAWDEKADQLRQRAIPLGLDLIGGVDVTLMLDREQMVKNDVLSFVETLKEEFSKAKISATVSADESGQSFLVKVTNAQDARNAYNTMKNYEGRLSSVPAEAQLVSGVRLTLDQRNLQASLKGTIEGARKGISDRVDQLGVTQPRISIQGQDRIRVQVPGEKDPDRLIKTVIQPANLEFHLVDERMNEVIGPDGKLKPGTVVPLGTMVVPGKLGKVNQNTQQVEYSDTNFLITKKAELTGADLRRADVTYNSADLENPIQVSLEFKPDGAKKFAEVTEKNVGRRLAILLDGVVRSAPNLKEAIREGRATISGGFTNEEASDLSQILKAGSLPAPLKIESKRTVGASIGADSIKSGVDALLWGTVIVALFMIVYYGTAGVIAVFALALNVLIILAAMALAKATLTLSGIGGILLTIGMAVDANILIYERMREEVAAGRPMRQAIALGFERAFAAILDSNVTTLLSALVLLQFTEGSVFGFALTMTFGLIANLFTGLTVTYTLCALWFQWRGGLSLGKLHILSKTSIDFIKMRWLTWTLSGLFLLILLVAVVARGGLQFGVDFSGGYRAEVQFKQPIPEEQIRKTLLDAGLKDPNVQQVTNTQEANLKIIDVKLLDVAKGALSTDQVQQTEQRFEQALSKAYPGQYEIHMRSSFGAQSSQEFSTMALMVTLLASGAILIYLWFRFELIFGVAAVVSLLHDILVVFLLACLWGVQVNLEVVAAMMVLMGFSVNDTIVVFDRIREDTRSLHSKSFGEVCNLAMNQTLSRTILTSGTVFLVVLVLYLIGGEGLRSFAKVYLLGTVFGTYSSDFIAAPMVYQWNKYKGNRLQMALAAKKGLKKEEAKPIRSASAVTRPGA